MRNIGRIYNRKGVTPNVGIPFLGDESATDEENSETPVPPSSTMQQRFSQEVKSSILDMESDVNRLLMTFEETEKVAWKVKTARLNIPFKT